VLDPAAPAPLRRVGGGVGLAEEHVGVGLAGVDRHADAGADADLAVSDAERFGERGAESFGDVARVEHAVVLGAQHDELVATPPTDHVAGAHDLPEPLGDMYEHLVARIVAVDVVGVLEAVEVDEEDGELAHPRAVAPRVLEETTEPTSVPQPRQWLVFRIVFQRQLAHPAVGDVFDLAEERVRSTFGVAHE
jgi:hypothetical protein